MRLARFLAFVGFLLFSQLSSALDAPPGLIPPGLNPGDEFYIIFAGSDTLDGAQSAATYAAYAATVKANDPDTNAISGWISLFGHDDTTLVTTSAFGGNTSQPIYNTNGDKVADNRAELFSDALDSAIGYDESGAANANNIWTGFLETGAAVGIGDDSLGGHDFVLDGCLVGNAGQADERWAASIATGGAGCTGANFGLYVLSPLLSVTAPLISIAPGSPNFGSHVIGSTSNEYTVTLSNSSTGTADWEISSIDAAVAPFAATGGTCGATPITIAIGDSCTLTYTFNPGAAGPASQNLVIASNALSSPDSLALQGVGLFPEPVPTLNQYAQLFLALVIIAVASVTVRRLV
ncbi:choice-of-anchor D domain-containing protein [Parahaliea mediterranea]|uniref:Choice-of-anchor D domain-containing protein n=1 Tax=Parahaliea mediterranea TaxID=651086 RepID=A0A939IPB4_9GAMM|nr:choice-of-anchor D domain-containing protein [Parahaliea mediterranea]MBN7798872.1 choice-of-anchor D domain-containing protein [Parahaliea mediterranea]